MRPGSDPLAPTADPVVNVSGFPVVGRQKVSFSELGLQTEEFNGRLYRAGFDLLMPPDFYPADYDKLTLSISAGYAKGLSPGAQILVRVNDKEAGSMPMRNPRGDLFEDRPIAVSLSALRPGVNRIVVEAQTPAPEDAACEVRALMDPEKRFVLFDRSELIVPDLARIARMPNLAAYAVGRLSLFGRQSRRACSSPGAIPRRSPPPRPFSLEPPLSRSIRSARMSRSTIPI